MAIMSASIFWYDFETTGINPKADRAVQVAGLRTDLELNEIDEPINYYCQLADDILPHPEACLVTGITPDLLASKGLKEAEFFKCLHEELIKPQTCVAGYNSIRFDDEVTRYGLYRNFFDPYGREWQGGNSRWDIIDLLRTTYALRPEGINWPVVEGQVSLKLELLTDHNGISHSQAHDALSDVRATIALARLVKERQPKLYDYLFKLRLKREVEQKITLLKPLVHISGRFAATRHYLSIVLPLAWHPVNKNALIVCDLQKDVSPLLTLSSEQLATYLYTKHEELPADILPISLKLIHINKCPVIAPLGVLREQDITRLAVDLTSCFQQAELLIKQQALWRNKLIELYKQADSDQFITMIDDPEQQLYTGFLSNRDKKQCDYIRHIAPAQLAKEAEAISFEDERLAPLLFRYRARNYPETLSKDEQTRWQLFNQHRLTDSYYGAPCTLAQFQMEVKKLLASCTIDQRQILLKWQAYGELLAQRYLIS